MEDIEVAESIAEYFCDPCKFTGKRIPAKGFCKTCNGNLCKECVKAHKNSRETRDHKITDIKKLSNKGNSSGIGSYCEEHKGILESHCPGHNSLCCRQCITTTHRDCNGLIPLHRAADGIHDTKEAEEVTKALELLTARFERTKRDENAAFHSVDVQGKLLEQTVKSFRKDVNKLLDKLEMCVLWKRDEVCKDEKSVLSERIGVCDKVMPMLTKSREHLEKLTNKTDEQTAFITIKSVKHFVEKYEELHEELVDGQGKFTLKFTPNQEFVKALDSLGSIVVRSTVQPAGSFEARLPGKPNIRKLIQSGEVTIRAPSDTRTCTITGCTLLEDKRLALADETNKCIKVLSPELKITAYFKMESAPWDLAAISKNEIAIRSSFSDNDDEENKIQVLKVGAVVKKDRSFSVDGRPRAIKYCKPYLYIACSEGKNAHILILDSKDQVVKRIRPKIGVLNQPQYLAISPKSDVIYVSDFYNGIVALNAKGEVKYQFRDSHVTEYGGITVDTNGEVYSCAGKPYGIYKVSEDGKELSPLVTWKETTIDPQAIIYNGATDKFLVTSCSSDKAYIFTYEQ